jgi:hypothetical protein
MTTILLGMGLLSFQHSLPPHHLEHLATKIPILANEKFGTGRGRSTGQTLGGQSSCITSWRRRTVGHYPPSLATVLTNSVDIVAFIGEFIGTTMFLFFAFAGTQLANIETGDTSIQIVEGQPTGFNPATLFYISASFGFSLMVTAWIFFRISGGLFNPAVCLRCI